MTAFTWRMSVAALALIAASGAARAVGGEPAAEPAVVPLADIAVPIVDHGEVEGMLHIKAALNAGDDGTAAATEAALPMARAALLGAAAEQARLYASPQRAVDQVRLHAALAAAVRQSGIEADVLILQAVARPAA